MREVSLPPPGGGGHRNRGQDWACLDWSTGQTLYSADTQPNRSAWLTYADGMLYTLNDKGLVAPAPATPGGFHIVSQFTLPTDGEGPVGAHPVVCGGRPYLGHGEFLYASYRPIGTSPATG